MTTNFEQAVDLIADATIPPGTSIRLGRNRAVLAAKLLDNADLLLPDPPATRSRTLADMTPEERQACVGRWCDNLISAADVPAPVVLACVQGELCWILHTSIHGERSCFPLDSLVPRPDLPRAWNPDGTPPALSG